MVFSFITPPLNAEKERAIETNRQPFSLNDLMDYLMNSLARSAIRKAKWHSVPDIAPRLIQHFAFFAPVISDVMLYFDEITDEEFSKAWAERFAGLVCDEVLDNELVRYWIEWYWSKYAGYLNRPEIRNHIAGSSFIDNQARAAITTRNLAWVRDKKTEKIHLGSWERRAVLNAARVQPSEERRHWLQMTIAHSPILIDRWVAKWVLDIRQVSQFRDDLNISYYPLLID